jgi:hypothetical protein
LTEGMEEGIVCEVRKGFILRYLRV